MSNITFAEIMEFYPEHNNSVYEDLKKDYQRGCLIPFVGAGLSVFCGYLNWPDILKYLAKFFYNKDKQTQIETMIDDGELLQAAQEIYDHYPRMLRELQKIVDYEKIHNCDTCKLYASAAYVLPCLFRSSLVMTTNFDRVLEEVYDRHHAKFGKIVSPYEPDLLTQIRQANLHCLFKLHGDIGPEIHDAEKLVFTQTQYDRAYAADGPLMQELSQWFLNKRLLFLGCSLAKDKTMEVLQTVTEKNSELDHYAILSCKPDDIERRTSELGELGISAIYYPSGKHDAVRVILERLLEETNYNAYEELSRYTGELVSTSGPERRFMYDSNYIAFTGREEELAQLDAFCQSSELISWWAVTGPGGMGKSRLVHEFVKGQRDDGWKVYWLKHNDYQKLSQWTPPADPCIVVADDVQAHLQAIGDWIISIFTRRRSEKLRLLLLERDGGDLNSAKWAEILQADSPYDDTISSKCYCPNFLQLKPLSEEELKTIMENFAAASGKPLADGGHADRLLQALQKIDSKLQRPIYALAIADAWCSGKDPSHWDKGQVLDTLVDHELGFYYKRLQDLSEKKLTKQMRTELENLLARSCLTSFLPLDHIPDEECPKLRRRADELDMDLPELLRLTGVVHKGKMRIFEVREDGAENQVGQTESIEAVMLDCPDLVKEYLALRQALDKGQRHLLFPDHWDNNPQQLIFLLRVLRDYPEKLEGNNQFWNEFFAGNPRDSISTWIYSDLLFGVTVQIQKMKKRAIDQLEKLHKQFPASEEIAFEYARSLVNLTAEQVLEDCVLSVQKLELLYEQFQASKKIAFEYAKGFANLTTKQTLKDCVLSVQKIEFLHKQFPANEEIAVVYASSLVNLTIKQTLEDCTLSVQRLGLLHEQFPGNEEIAVFFAKGLIIQNEEQTTEDLVHSVQRVELLNQRFPASEEIAVVCANGLFNLTIKQTLEDCTLSVQRLELLHEQFPASEEIAVVCANGLFNLTIKQTLEDCTLSVQRLELLHEQFPGSEEIAVVYAASLVNLSFQKTTEADAQETLEQSEKIFKQYPKNTEIQLSRAKTYFNLTLQQSPDALRQTVEKLREYLLAHSDANKEFQTALDKYLCEHPEHTERYKPLRV